jgi:FKBP-type peptidyl-prolyl cis-trans isomerase
MVEVQYIGMLKDGTIFDQSFPRGQPISFPLGAGAVIDGWDEGLALLNVGAKATFFIPATLGYGPVEQGPIPANSDLIFYVELESAK